MLQVKVELSSYSVVVRENASVCWGCYGRGFQSFLGHFANLDFAVVLSWKVVALCYFLHLDFLSYYY